MKIIYKNLILPAMIAALSGCGGSSSDVKQTAGDPNNLAPVVDEAGLVFAQSTTSTREDGTLEWTVNFSESDNSFVDPADSAKFIEHFDIDLLMGVSDPDNSGTLSVKDIEFIWPGPDCSDNKLNGVNYPEICQPVYDTFAASLNGFEVTAETDLVFGDIDNIRSIQNLPVVAEPLYGFELKQSFIRVKPSLFAPILLSGETAELNLIYIVSDGDKELERRIRVTVNGHDSAPQFIKLKEDGSPALDEDGNVVELDQVKVTAFEKSEKVTVNLIEGMYDADIYNIKQREREVGDLSQFYDQGNYYVKERIGTFGSVTASNGSEIPDGFANTVPVFDPVTNELTAINLSVNPQLYVDILAAGETLDIVFNYTVTDGNNDVPRTLTFTIVGADLFNAPTFDTDLAVDIKTSDYFVDVNLFEGIIDPDGDSISVVNFVPGPDSEGFGIDLSSAGKISIDPYAFLYLQTGEKKELTYTYSVSDGGLSSAVRNVAITITGSEVNLLARGAQSDAGFETGSLDSSAWKWQWSPTSATTLEVLASAAHSGSYGLNVGENSTFIELQTDGILHGQIEEGDDFYLNFFAKTPGAWTSIRGLFNENGVWSDPSFLYNEEHSSLGAADSWVERTSDFEATDFFNPDTDETFSLTFLTGENIQMDDFSIVKYGYERKRDLIPDGYFFNSGDSEGFTVTGDATLNVTEAANRFNNDSLIQYGLEIVGGTGTENLVLDSSFFKQGAVQNGIRYIVQFDLKHESYSGDALQMNTMIQEEGGSNYARRLKYAKQTNAWNTYKLHINTVSDGNDLAGAVTSDVDFDWGSAVTNFALQIPAGQTVYIDNIRVFPVPQ